MNLRALETALAFAFTTRPMRHNKSPFSHRVVALAQAVQAVTLLFFANDLFVGSRTDADNAKQRVVAGGAMR